MPKFEKTYCSNCGGEFGPGDTGFSHCDQHAGRTPEDDKPRVRWDDCRHHWRLKGGDWDAPEGREMVECKKCGVPGERDTKDDSVFWPAT